MSKATSAPGSSRHRHDAASPQFSFTFEGREIPAWRGQTVAAALLAADVRFLRRDEFGEAKGVFCGIGFCWECRCRIDGAADTRACMTEARAGMVVARQDGLG